MMLFEDCTCALSIASTTTNFWQRMMNSLFEKLKILASLFDTMCTMMNRITELDSQEINDFGIICKVFGVFWRKYNFNGTPKVHVVESHLIDAMKRFGRVGLFNENPIERAHKKVKYLLRYLQASKAGQNWLN